MRAGGTSDSSSEEERPPDGAPEDTQDRGASSDADPMIQDEPLLTGPGTGYPPENGADDSVDAAGTPGAAQDEPMPGALTSEEPMVGGRGDLGATSGEVPDESMPEAPSPGHGDAPMGNPGGGDISDSPTPPPDAPMPDGPGTVTEPTGTGGELAGAHKPRGAGGQKRKGARDQGPRGRAPHGWVTSIQQPTRTKATCRDCGNPFSAGELRVSTVVNARGDKSTYSHVECVQGGSTRSTRSNTVTPSHLTSYPRSRPFA